MSQLLNRYKADLRDLKFLLWEQFKLQDLLGKAPYAAWGTEEVDTVLSEVYAWVQKVTGPYNAVGDHHGCGPLAVQTQGEGGADAARPTGDDHHRATRVERGVGPGHQPVPVGRQAARVASMVATRSGPHGSGMTTGWSTPASRWPSVPASW